MLHNFVNLSMYEVYVVFVTDVCCSFDLLSICCGAVRVCEYYKCFRGIQKSCLLDVRWFVCVQTAPVCSTSQPELLTATLLWNQLTSNSPLTHMHTSFDHLIFRSALFFITDHWEDRVTPLSFYFNEIEKTKPHHTEMFSYLITPVSICSAIHTICKTRVCLEHWYAR